MACSLRSAALAAAIMLVTVGAALAVPLVSPGGAKVYPGFDNDVPAIGYMAPGAVYDGTCNTGNSGWCRIRTESGNAYVEASKVQQAPGQPTGVPNFSIEFGIGNNNPPPRPPSSGGGNHGGNGGGFDNNDNDMVCFYERNDFAGKSFCAEPGDASDQLPRSWNDRISSIEVFGDAEVEVCRDSDMEGACSVIRRDTSRLPSRLNDRISSFEVN